MLMGLFELVFAIIVLGLSVVLSVGISQPFQGALIRLRANYLPKAVSLDSVLEDGANANGNGLSGVRGVTPRTLSGYFLREQQSAAKIGPVVGGILAMMQRTKRLEGWPGIYKGSAPVACQLLVLGFVTLVLFNVGGITGTGGGSYRSAPSGPGQFSFFGNLFFMLISSLVALPLNVITNRATVHPRILTFRNIRDNLRELLSYSEYSQPWRLYLVPGLLATQFSHIFWIGFLTRLVRHVTVPSLGGLPPSTPAAPGDDQYSGPSTQGGDGLSTFGLAVFLFWCVFSVIVLSPLESVIVRLSVQRPERQQPLHLAYARVQATGPAPYNNQAQVAQSAADATSGSYSDSAAERTSTSANEPTDPAPRPSFAIEDDEEEEPAKEGKANGAANSTTEGNASSKPSTMAEAEGARPTSATQQRASNVAGSQARSVPPSPQSPFRGGGSGSGSEPTEPVIALRPCDEPLSEEEAQRAESEGFGAATVERYTGMIDCLNKLIDEEGIEALYRGAWVTLLGILVGNFS